MVSRRRRIEYFRQAEFSHFRLLLVWPRQMNAAAIPIAQAAGYDVMPNYWIKQGRPQTPLPYGISTDAHHAADMYVAKQRSPWLHASTQALLMMLCGPEAYS